MNARNVPAAARLVRAAAVLALACLLAAVGLHFAGRRRAAGPPAAPAPPPEQKVDRKEGVRHREFKDGRIEDEVRADRFYLGADGLNHLEGAVNILDFGRGAGRPVSIRAEAAAYDKDLLRFTLSGRVRIETDEVVLTAASAVFDKEQGVFRADEGGAFTSGKLTGSARTVVHDQKRDVLLLQGRVRIIIEPRAGAAEGAVLTLGGNSVSYDRKARTGRLTGGAEVRGKGFEGTSESLDFRASGDEGSLETMAFEGGARCIFHGNAGPGDEGLLEAGRILVRPVPGSSGLRRVDATGDCRLRAEAPSAPRLEAQARELGLAFAEDGNPAAVEASGAARMTLDDPQGGLRRVTALRAVYDRASGVLEATAAEGETAAAETPTALVEATALRLDAGRRSVEAGGGVKCRVKARPGAPAMGFFGRDEPLFVACGRLSSGGPEGDFRFSGVVRAWQGRTVLRAEALEASETSGDVRARGGVGAVFFSRPKAGGAEERYEAGGRDLDFSAGEASAVFRGAAFVVTGQARLEAEAILVRLLDGNLSVGSLSAEGAVVIKRGGAEGRGGQALYDPEAGTIVLTGRPVLVDGGRGTFQADKLTFELADDRILVETAGQGRSVTIVKSQR